MDDLQILRGKWFCDCHWDSQTPEQSDVNRIIMKLMGYPLQILDFMLDWFYRDLKKFPFCVIICNVFKWKPCIIYKLENPWFIYNNLCIDYFDFLDAVDLLERYNLIRFSESKSEDYSCKVFFNIERIIYLLRPAQTKDSKIFVDILQKLVDVHKEMELNIIKQNINLTDDLCYGRGFPDIDYFLKHPLNMKSYE